MLNLCHFDINVAGIIHPRTNTPLLFEPTVEEAKPFVRLQGFILRKVFSTTVQGSIPEPGTEVIVPRFASAVGWALQYGLVPFCAPLSGARQSDGSFICTELEPAPADLAVSFPEKMHLFPEEFTITRAIGGAFTVEVLDGPDLLPVDTDATTYRTAAGVHIPALDAPQAILVPQDGLTIEKMAISYPGVPLLVTDVTVPGSRTRLLQVR